MKVAVAHIRGPRGIKGELAAHLYKENSGTIRKGLEIFLVREMNEYSGIIEEIKELSGRIAIKISGIDTPEAAEEWRNSELYVAEADLEPLEEDEYYLHELEGMTVLTEENQKIGTVEKIDTQTANAILNIKNESGGIILVPFVKAIVKEINKKGKKIIIEYIEGLY